MPLPALPKEQMGFVVSSYKGIGKKCFKENNDTYSKAELGFVLRNPESMNPFLRPTERKLFEPR